MRRLFVVTVLLAVMVALARLQIGTLGQGDPMTLAAIGFVVLAAFASAELGARMGLPKVTGYILTGVLLGPKLGDILSANVVEEMRMFSTLTLGLIATTAGLELDLKMLRRSAMTLGVTVAAKVLFLLIFVVGALYAAESTFGWLGLESSGSILAVAFIFAALAVATSPAIAIAIIEESQAKGRLSELVLGAAVLKDVVVVVSLAVAIAVAQGLVGGSSLDPSTLIYVAQEILASTLAGAILGGLLIAYIRFVHAEMRLFVAAVVLVVAEISEALHLELLLVFIVAGLVVRNFSEYEHELLHPLQTISLPVFIIFFTNTGAGVDLQATISLLPLALILCGARALAYFLSSQIAGRVGKEPTPIKNLAWMGYLPQAGVALGLVGLASQKMGLGPDELGSTIQTLGMAVVTVNLLVGPITLRMALRRAGELPEESESTEVEKKQAEEQLPEKAPIPALADPRLAASLSTVSGELLRIVERNLHVLQREHITPWVRSITPPDSMREQPIERADFITDTIAHTFLHDPPTQNIQAKGLLRELSAVLDKAPEQIIVPLEQSLAKVDPQDSWRLRLQKYRAAVADFFRGRRNKRIRVVPARRILKSVMELRLAEAAVQVQARFQRLEIETLQLFRRDVIGTAEEERLRDELPALAQLANFDAHHLLETAIQSGIEVATEHFRRAGGPGYSGGKLRYSRVEKDISATHRELFTEAERWPEIRQASSNFLQISTEIQQVRNRVRQILQQQVTRVVSDAHDLYCDEIAAMLTRLEKLELQIQGFLREDTPPAKAEADSKNKSPSPESKANSEAKPETEDDDELSEEEQRAQQEALRERLQMEVGAVLPKNALKRLRIASARVRNATSNRTAATVIEAFVQAGDKSTEIVPDLATLLDSTRPSEVRTVRIDLHEIKQARLSSTLVPAIESALTEVWDSFQSLRQEMLECANLAKYVAGTSQDQGDEDWYERLLSGLEQAKKRLLAAAEGFDHLLEALVASLNEAIAELGEGLMKAVEDSAINGDTAGTGGLRARANLNRFGKRWARLQTGLEALQTGLQTRLQGFRDLSKQLAPASEIPDLGDASAVRRFLAGQTSRVVDSDLPPLYPPLFRITPIRDSRLYATHLQGLEIVVGAERAWRQDRRRGNAVLVTGATGAGKTSLLTIAELKFATRRALTLRERKDPNERFLNLLRHELGCVDQNDAIVKALSRHSGLIVIDNLHHWLRPTSEGIADAERLFAIIERSREHCFWLVACLDESFALFDATMQVSRAFPYVVHLKTSGAAELQSVISSRQNLAGLPVQYPQTRWQAFTHRIRGRTPASQYFLDLERLSGGSLRRALSLWLGHASSSEDASIVMRPLQDVVPLVELLQKLSNLELALISCIMRFGALDAAFLATQLVESESKIQGQLSTLESYELIEQIELSESKSPQQFYDVRPAVRDAVSNALRQLNLWSAR